MTSHLLYEGSELERVLERVRADHGPAAAIVAADRVRRGGVGGFFAKEVFQVTVALDEDGAPVDTGAGSPAGAGAVAGPGVAAGTAGGPATGPVALGRIGDGVDEADLELWGIVGSSLATATTPSPHSGPAFAAALEAALDEQPPVALESSGPRVVSGLTRHDPPLPVGSRPGPAEEPLPGIVTARLDRAATDAPTGGARVVELRQRRVRRDATGARDLGALLGELEQRWEEPPALPDGGLVVILGGAAEAHRVARLAADALGIALRDVLVAAPPEGAASPEPGDLAALNAAVARTRSPLLVVEVRPGRDGHDWARDVVAGLNCVQVRLALDATRPLSTLELSLTALGGSEVVDVVDLVDVDSAAAPEELLELDARIGTLDGRTASPALWAAVLMSALRGVDAHHIDRRSAVSR